MNRIIATAIVIGLTGSAHAQSLAGYEGEVRTKTSLSLYESGSGTCYDTWKGYVAAPGHSAYITTPPYSSQIFCTAWVNGRSKQEAERLGLAHCAKQLKHYRGKWIQKCVVAASK